MVENIGCLNSNRTDAIQEFFKNSVFALVIQVAAFFQECPQFELFRRVLAVEGIIVFQQMLLVRHIVGFVLLAALRLHEKVNGLPNQCDINDLSLKGLCMLDICVKLIPAQNVVALALMTGNLCKGKKFIFRYQLRAEGKDNLLCLVQRDDTVEICHCIEIFAQKARGRVLQRDFPIPGVQLPACVFLRKLNVLFLAHDSSSSIIP